MPRSPLSFKIQVWAYQKIPFPICLQSFIVCASTKAKPLVQGWVFRFANKSCRDTTDASKLKAKWESVHRSIFICPELHVPCSARMDRKREAIKRARLFWCALLFSIHHPAISARLFCLSKRTIRAIKQRLPVFLFNFV